VHLFVFVFVCRIENPLVCVEGKDEKDEDDEEKDKKKMRTKQQCWKRDIFIVCDALE